MDLGLTGKGALVVGAGADIGRATAVTLAAEGARVVLAGRNRERLEATKAAVASAGGEAHVLVADVSSAEQARDLALAAAGALGRIDILVNTVGPFPRDPSVTEPMFGHDESWLKVFDDIFLTAVRICREVIPMMKAAGAGAVVNTSANSARAYYPNTAQYGVMKAALLHVTKNWARDGANAGVRVNAIMPGWVKGEGVEARLAEEAARTGQPLADIEADLVGRHAGVFWSRRMGRPQDYADAIAFLVSERAAYINGALLPVDGGSGV